MNREINFWLIDCKTSPIVPLCALGLATLWKALAWRTSCFMHPSSLWDTTVFMLLRFTVFLCSKYPGMTDRSLFPPSPLPLWRIISNYLVHPPIRAPVDSFYIPYFLGISRLFIFEWWERVSLTWQEFMVCELTSHPSGPMKVLDAGHRNFSRQRWWEIFMDLLTTLT